MIKENQEKITQAIYQDMGRPYFEAYGAEVGVTLSEISYIIKHLKRWAKPEKIRPGLAFFKSSAKMEYRPKGLCLIVSPWNYPFALSLIPLAANLAAGNVVAIKPSEYTVHSVKLLDNLIAKYFEPEQVDVIPGGIDTGQALLKEDFDQIIFTGSERVGKLYARAAAESFTPIILELGGKSPTIVDETAKMDVTAERILFGKLLNSAQTCVAPDYLLVHKNIKNRLVVHMKKKLQEFYGEDPLDSDDLGRIINQQHTKRLISLLEENRDQIIFGGEYDLEERYIQPTFIDNPSLDSRIMEEEIFGPILPIVTYETFEDIRQIVAKNPNPLALYIYSEDREFIEEIKKLIPAGDIAINDSAIHFAVAGLKFGGVRSSGYSAYQGRTGFENLSHKQTVFERSTRIKLPFTKPPYTNFKERILKFFLR